ncbi:MAG: hypothetical protein ISR65_12055 [Bacteriovoracaceae bacterium]|nr:hypothetical protein [Bacteriovoracaceae bacterium]
MILITNFISTNVGALEYYKSSCQKLESVHFLIREYVQLHNSAINLNNGDYNKTMEGKNALDTLNCIVDFAFLNKGNYEFTIRSGISSLLQSAKQAKKIDDIVALQRLNLELNSVWFQRNALKRLKRDEQETSVVTQQALGAAGVMVLLAITKGTIHPKALIKIFKPLQALAVNMGKTNALPQTLSVILSRLGFVGYEVADGMNDADEKKLRDCEKRLYLEQDLDQNPYSDKDQGVWNSPIYLTGIANHKGNETLDFANYAFYRDMGAMSTGVGTAYVIQGKTIGKVKQLSTVARLSANLGRFGALAALTPQVVLGVAISIVVTEGVMWTVKKGSNLISKNKLKNRVRRLERLIETFLQTSSDTDEVTSINAFFDLSFQYRMAIEDLAEYQFGKYNEELKKLEASFIQDYICEGYSYHEEILKNPRYRADTASVKVKGDILQQFTYGQAEQTKIKQQLQQDIEELLDDNFDDIDKALQTYGRGMQFLGQTATTSNQVNLHFHKLRLNLVRSLVQNRSNVDTIWNEFTLKAQSRYNAILSAKKLKRPACGLF